MKHIKNIAIFLLIIFANTLYAGLSYEIDWKSIETENFQIVFDAKHERLALEYAQKAESAKLTLEQVFSLFPKKTTIVITDYFDQANGGATNFPYPIIYVYPVLPTPIQSISHFDDWAFNLLLHEYTHTAQLFRVEGVWKFLRIFGNAAFAKNSLLPRWYVEGVAVDVESSYSKFGRLNDIRLYANARAMTEDNIWGSEDLHQINGHQIPTWPMGQRRYMFGGMLINQIRKDVNLEDLNISHAEGMLSSVNESAKKLTGKDYHQHLRRAYERIGSIASVQLSEIKSHGVHDTKKLPSKNGVINHSPSISDDESKLLFVAQNRASSDIILVERGLDNSFISGKQRTILSANGIDGVSWISNTEFVYNAIEPYKSRYNYSDLFIGDINGNKKRLTYGARLQFAQLSYSNKLLAIQIDADINRIVTVDLDSKDIKAVYEAAPGVRLAYPISLDQERMLFSEKTNGSDLVKVFDLSSNTASLLQGVKIESSFLSKVKGGFLYASKVSGVSNVYFWSEELEDSWPLTNSTTHSLGGVWDESSGELIYSELKGDGYHLVGTKSNLAEEVQVANIQVPYTEPDISKVLSPEADYAVTDYKYHSYLLPKYWWPAISSSRHNSHTMGSYLLHTSSYDPTESHEYNLILGLQTLSEHAISSGERTIKNLETKFNYYFNYNNRMFPIDIGVRASSRYALYEDDFTDVTEYRLDFDRYLSSDNRFIGGVGLVYQSLHDTWSGYGPELSLRYRDITRRMVGGHAVRKGPDLEIGYSYFISSTGDNKGVLGITTMDNDYYWPIFDLAHELKLKTYHTFIHGANYIDRDLEYCYTKSTIGVSGSRLYPLLGYSCSLLKGKNLHNISLSYKLPILDIYSNLLSIPFFLKTLHGRFTIDNLYLMDGMFNSSTGRKGINLTSVGLELSLNTSIMYGVPFEIVFGLYQGFNKLSVDSDDSVGFVKLLVGNY